MKKTLSIFLVVAMLLCMAPVFGAFAGEADAYTIANADDYLAFVASINDGSYAGSNNIKVTGDLDFTGKDYVAMGTLPSDKILDFDGHAIMNVNYTLDASTVGNGEIGFVANSVGNRACIKNLTIKDSTFTVTGNATAIGGLVGRLDRAEITNINTDNYTINYDGTKADGNAVDVGGLVALQHWSYTNHEVVLSGNLKDFTINAPQSNVGILCAWTEDWDANSGMWITVKNVTGNVTADGKNEVTADTLFYAINGNTAIDSAEYTENVDNHYIDAASINVTVNEESGDAPADPPVTDAPATDAPATDAPATDAPVTDAPAVDDKPSNDKPAQTGDAAVFAVALAVIALVGVAVIAKKRSAC